MQETNSNSNQNNTKTDNNDNNTNQKPAQNHSNGFNNAETIIDTDKTDKKDINKDNIDADNNTMPQKSLEEQIKEDNSKKNILKNLAGIRDKIKEFFENKLLSKTRKRLQIETLFESVGNANTIFKVERKIGDYLILIAGFFFITSLIELILIISLFPLKEKEPYLVTFSTSTQNFAIVQKADSKITANKALIRQLLGAYILNRETINRIDDQARFDIVREQSSPEVWRIFERIVANQDSIYTNDSLKRNVQIINISTIKKGYANADVDITLYANGLLQSEKRYRIVIAYQFEPIEIDFHSMPKNPTGFIVTGYFITEIATIKELNPENQVQTPKESSKIKYKNPKKKPDALNDGLNDATINGVYQYNLKNQGNQEKASQSSNQSDIKSNLSNQSNTDSNTTNTNSNVSDTASDTLNADEIQALQKELEKLKKIKEFNKAIKSENLKEQINEDPNHTNASDNNTNNGNNHSKIQNSNTNQENLQEDSNSKASDLRPVINPLKSAHQDNKESETSQLRKDHKDNSQKQQMVSPFAGGDE
ncbi:hypothetical protein BKH41_04115 [Helicobacter sp. 12S02232-10]|uniref:type IV secretion system protein n=1 Tax=Helicobacter sp. 12S02232-10 TaxID=1476197 RepID=UPI000BA7BC76|nr:VirB8/TrbF family protein [Helicobacter sp. 12S02232-10]PAF48820.1 hypothetical protein BKH41_04115 [Helicobacter sp. 12S02232-10]